MCLWGNGLVEPETGHLSRLEGLEAPKSGEPWVSLDSAPVKGYRLRDDGMMTRFGLLDEPVSTGFAGVKARVCARV